MSDFYNTNGTMGPSDDSYIVRRCDTELYEALQQGEFCYALTSRQMGKSSLMVRTKQRLEQSNVKVAYLDLSGIGTENVTLSQWYNSLLSILGEQLNKKDELDDFSDSHSELSNILLWFTAIKQVILPDCPQGLVISIDEIDTVRKLPFSTDDFFAGIRACYNQRSQEPALQKLTFCLSGVAAPSDLIQDSRITPFNIGRRVVLEDFTLAEAAPLARGLGREDTLAKILLERIVYWTNGQPYLTQNLCHAVALDTTISQPQTIDKLCEGIFLSSRSRDSDHNLSSITNVLLRREDKQYDKVPILELYRKVYKGRPAVRDDDTNPLISQLLLSGLVKVVNNTLQVRNRIYAATFNLRWIDSSMPGAELRRQKAAFRRGVIWASVYATIIIVALVGLGGWYWDSYLREIETYYP